MRGVCFALISIQTSAYLIVKRELMFHNIAMVVAFETNSDLVNAIFIFIFFPMGITQFFFFY